MQLPSGESYSALDLQILRRMSECGFVRYSEKPFRLKSGIDSHVYVFGREDLTDNPDLEWIIGERIVLEVSEGSIEGDKRPCLIGIPTAGTALAQAAAMVSWDMSRVCVPPAFPVIAHRIMREGKKEHGVHHKWVNGDPSPEHTYWAVDNVVTDGASKFEAAEKLAESGYESFEMPQIVLVDRQQGGIKKMEEGGFKRVHVIYRLLDISFALGEFRLWPKEVVSRVEEEIRAHQFA